MAAAESGSSICSTLFDKKRSVSKEFLIHYFQLRVQCVYKVRGNDTRFFMCRPAWHVILVDNNKKYQFSKRKNSGTLDVADYGRILHSGWGEKVPAHFLSPYEETSICIPTRFHLNVKQIGKYKYCFYALLNENYQELSKSVPILEQIESCAKLLHAGWGAEVPEAVADVFLKAMLEQNFKSDWTEYDNCIYSSARNGEVDKLKCSGLNSCKLDSNGWTLLHHAAYGGNIEVINFLIEKKADVHKQDIVCGRKPVHIACREGHIDVVKLFMQQGMDVNDGDHNGWTLLHYASWNGNIDLVQFLVKEKRANFNAQDVINKKKPFHIAAREGHTELVEFFCTEGMDIEDKDAEDRTPLYYAAFGAQLGTLRFLVSKGASIHCRNTNGASTVHLACYNNDVVMLEYLIKKKCDVEAKDNRDWTPLHAAASEDSFECVNYICKVGANLSARTKSMQTPLDIARKYNSTEVTDFLSAKEAEKICDKENYTEALQVYRKLYSVQNKNLGNSHLDTLYTRSQIASLHSKLEEHSEALQIHTEVYNERKRITENGANHPDTLMSHYNMGSAMDSLFRYTDAGSIYASVLVKREELIGADHEDTLQVRHDLASIYAKQSRFDVALHIFQDVYHRRKATLGPNHLDTLASCEKVGVVLANTGELMLAVQHFKEVFEKRNDVLGPDHPDTSLAKLHVTIWSEKLGSSQMHNKQCDSVSDNWFCKGLKILNLM